MVKLFNGKPIALFQRIVSKNKYTHAQESCTHVKDPVVHVRVWWIMQTRKDPAQHALYN